MKSLKYAAFLILLIAGFGLAEVSGTISPNQGVPSNITFVTGLFGYTVSTCSSDANCLDYKCFFDYDTSGTYKTNAGLCNATSSTTCIHDDSSSVYSVYSTATGICVNGTTYRTCTNGNWSGSVTLCTGGQTCSSGACSTPGSGSGTGSGSGGGNTSTTPTYKIDITPLSSFDLVQGNGKNFTVIFTNSGNNTLTNIGLSISGISSGWYNYSPSKILVLSKGNSNRFNVSLMIPSDADVKSYSVTVTVAAAEKTATSGFSVNVLPSQSSVIVIDESYLNYSKQIKELEKAFADLQSKNVVADDLTRINSTLSMAKTKLEKADEFIQNNDYFSAKQLLDDVKDLIATAQREIDGVSYKAPDSTIIYIAVVVAVIVIAVLAYMFWPKKKEQKLLTILREKRV